MFEDAVKDVQDANSDVDLSREEKNLAAAHFASEQLESGQDRLITLRHSVVSLIQEENYDTARRDSGHMFHTLQDLYSHSNWIENGNRTPNPVLGQPNQRIANIASPDQQTCTDCERKGFIMNVKTILKYRLYRMEFLRVDILMGKQIIKEKRFQSQVENAGMEDYLLIHHVKPLPKVASIRMDHNTEHISTPLPLC